MNMERRSSAIPPPDAAPKHYDFTFQLIYPATYRDTLPVLEKYDAELKKRRFSRTAKDWAKQIDEAEKNLRECTNVKPTLMTIEHGIMGEMEAALMVVVGPWLRDGKARWLCGYPSRGGFSTMRLILIVR